MLLEDVVAECLKRNLVGRNFKSDNETSQRCIVDVYNDNGNIFLTTKYSSGLEVHVPLNRPGNLSRYEII